MTTRKDDAVRLDIDRLQLLATRRTVEVRRGGRTPTVVIGDGPGGSSRRNYAIHWPVLESRVTVPRGRPFHEPDQWWVLVSRHTTPGPGVGFAVGEGVGEGEAVTPATTHDTNIRL